MADNFISYNRFTALPPNIADYGASVEELQLQRGKADANPMLSPMPVPRVSLQRLFLKPGGSDQLRVGEPLVPVINPYEGPQSTLSLSRNALRKLNGRMLGELEEQVDVGELGDKETTGLMADSLRRVAGMRNALDDLTKMAEGVYVRSVAASRG